ncbi:NPCBM/NEW2 domain-containing protein [Vallicoccus soli]|uniref:Glycosyl hydrolase family 98 putative carbohydrate-binding module domain-containing protein n=1 Tax=Vallicoccus soli TaxID=2339232 RepID=A0A3A3Z1C4_9ACTN|nr:NPCBM/NEW2 domain-containing protein [Vallicoccus soli]RJK98049.1 hypothetical protein D5H78_03680 [Vallicoccus soli]
MHRVRVVLVLLALVAAAPAPPAGAARAPAQGPVQADRALTASRATVLPVAWTRQVVHAGQGVVLATRLRGPDGRDLEEPVTLYGRSAGQTRWRALQRFPDGGRVAADESPRTDAEYFFRHWPSARLGLASSPVIRIDVQEDPSPAVTLQLVPGALQTFGPIDSCCPNLVADERLGPAVEGELLQVQGAYVDPGSATGTTRFPVLQTWTSGRWRAIGGGNLARSSWHTTTAAPSAGRHLYRAVLPAAPGLPAVVSGVRELVVTRQRTALSAPPQARQGTVLRFRGLSAPHRPGRHLAVQELRDGRWLSVASTGTGTGGASSLALRAPRPGVHRYRAVAADYSGAPARASLPVDVEVLPSPVPRPWVTHLDELSPATGEREHLVRGPVLIEGRTYRRSVQMSNGGSIVVELGTHAATLKAAVGAGPPEVGLDPVPVFTVVVDGRTVLRRMVPSQSAFPLSVDVRGARRAVLTFSSRGSIYENEYPPPRLLLGDAVVTSRAEPQRGLVPDALYLLDLPPVSTRGDVGLDDDGDHKLRSGPSEGALEYDLPRPYRRFTATARLFGEVVDAVGSVRVVGDGRLLASYDEVGTDYRRVDVDVTGVRHLRLELAATAGGLSYGLAVHDAALLP